MIKLEYEGKKSMKEVAEKFKSQLSQKEIMKTAAYTLNQTVDRVGGMLRNEIVKDYTVKKKDLKGSMPITKKAKGTPSGMYAHLSYSFRGIPLYKFKHKSLDKNVGFVTYNKKIKGVQVEIKKGKTTILKHAFIKSMPNGHTGIWMHGDYIGGKFVPKDRLTSKGKPVISELKSASPYGVITSKNMTPKVKSYVEKNLNDRFEILLQRKVDKLKR